MSEIRLTFTEEPANYLRGIAAAMNVDPPEAIRRALTVLTACVINVTSDEELIVRNRRTGSLCELSFEWERS